MNYAYKRSAGAMLTTSITTAVAFIATAASPIMPISGFGYFAACCVLMNYLLVMTVFPCLLIIWHDHIGQHALAKNTCFVCRPIDSSNIDGQLGVEHEEAEAAGVAAKEAPEAQDYVLSELTFLERMFLKYYSPLINSNAKYGMVLFTFSYMVFSAYWAVQMEPPLEQEQWFPDEHMITALTKQNAKFLGGDAKNYATVDLSWGFNPTDPIDRTEKFSRWIPEYVLSSSLSSLLVSLLTSARKEPRAACPATTRPST